jgi:YD repeat-containing protein
MGGGGAVSYARSSENSARLKVTATRTADNKSRSVTLDADGNLVRITDENGVLTKITRNLDGHRYRDKQ